MTPWTVAHQAPLSLGFSRQEHWSGLPWPSAGDLLNPGIEPRSPALQADSGKPCVSKVLTTEIVAIIRSFGGLFLIKWSRKK